MCLMFQLRVIQAIHGRANNRADRLLLAASVTFATQAVQSPGVCAVGDMCVVCHLHSEAYPWLKHCSMQTDLVEVK
jgi:hypothetical protein